MTLPKVLVTGAGGQLGRSLVQIAGANPFDFCFASQKDLDITDEEAIADFFGRHRFNFCINAAAFTQVDRAEEQETRAFAVNTTGAGSLARYCRLQHCALIQISTDYVYHNTLRRPLTEKDSVTPQSVYARSKLEGEQRAMKAHPETIIVRTSWLFSEYGQNFVRTIAKMLAEGRTLRVVNDQTGCPTYAGDLAKALMQIVRHLTTQPQSGISGIYNYCNSGPVTWYDFACAIRDVLGSTTEIIPIDSTAYGARAPRPAYSVLNTSKIREAFGVEIPHWRDGMLNVLRSLQLL